MLARPVSSEYNPYFNRYIKLAPQGDIREVLVHQRYDTAESLAGISEKASLYRYDSDKWTIKEVVGHISDTERVMAYIIAGHELHHGTILQECYLSHISQGPFSRRI